MLHSCTFGKIIMLSTSFHAVNAYYYAKQPINSTHVIYTLIQKKASLHIHPHAGSPSGWHGPRSQKQLDVTDLEHKAAEFLTSGLALNTRTTYTAGQQRFANFCQTINVAPIPASEKSLLLFATHLAASNITHTTIKVYISAIRHMHVTAGLHEEFNTQLTPRLQLMLKGIQRSQATSHPQRICLPITLEIM